MVTCLLAGTMGGNNNLVLTATMGGDNIGDNDLLLTRTMGETITFY